MFNVTIHFHQILKTAYWTYHRLCDSGRDGRLPYIIVTDYDFPLRTDLLKHYPFHNFLFPHRLFNYRLSRGRRIFENGFGILANRFRFFSYLYFLSRTFTSYRTAGEGGISLTPHYHFHSFTDT